MGPDHLAKHSPPPSASAYYPPSTPFPSYYSANFPSSSTKYTFSSPCQQPIETHEFCRPTLSPASNSPRHELITYSILYQNSVHFKTPIPSLLTPAILKLWVLTCTLPTAASGDPKSLPRGSSISGLARMAERAFIE